VPVALCEAVEDGRVQPGSTLLLPGFGGGLTFCAHLVRWGERVTPLAPSTVELPPSSTPALELIRDVMRRKMTART
jgi:3-oxoacyl-[acyl-carrier-protein] synthase-3